MSGDRNYCPRHNAIHVARIASARAVRAAAATGPA